MLSVIVAPLLLGGTKTLSITHPVDGAPQTYALHDTTEWLSAQRTEG